MLPDLIDKPLYYSLVAITGKRGAELGLISSGRTLAHTSIFLLILTGLSVAKKSKVLAAICWGVATHFFLDCLADRFLMKPGDESSALLAMLFPLLGFRFGIMPFQGAGEHAMGLLKPFNLGAEVIGILILAWDRWKSNHKGEIRANFLIKRFGKRKPRRKRSGPTVTSGL
jgi:hypothetical protein